MHSDNSFVTLTYRDSSLPMTSDGLPTLEPLHLQWFVKLLRKKIEPAKIRFYGVGEYGDETQRPHYHLAIFGFPTCRLAQTQYRNGSLSCCIQCQLVADTWKRGNIYLGTLETSSAQYVAGYVTKKMTSHRDGRLNGRHPEFARMSNRPGIGYDALHEVASQMLKFNLDKTQADVPVSLRHGNRELPLGRYMRMKLRKLIGKDEKTPQQVLDQLKAEMLPMRTLQFEATQKKTSLKTVIQEVNKGKRASFTARNSIFKQKRKTL